jgi:hypothetical protein
MQITHSQTSNDPMQAENSITNNHNSSSLADIPTHPFLITPRQAIKRLESQVRVLIRKRDSLKQTILGLKQEVWLEREARFVVERCLTERVHNMELEVFHSLVSSENNHFTI